MDPSKETIWDGQVLDPTLEHDEQDLDQLVRLQQQENQGIRDSVPPPPPPPQQQQQHQRPSAENSTKRASKGCGSRSACSAYSAWARAQARGASCFLLLGGLLCFLIFEWFFGVYSIVLGALVYSIERRPTSPTQTSHAAASSKGTFLPTSPSPNDGPPRTKPSSTFCCCFRRHRPQKHPPHPGSLLKNVLRSYPVKASIYLLAAGPCFLRASNYSGGLCLVSSGLTYAVAATIDWKARKTLRRH